MKLLRIINLRNLFFQSIIGVFILKIVNILFFFQVSNLIILPLLYHSPKKEEHSRDINVD
jgi:hypothetical protein